jgi:hypothetical protein
MIKNIFAEEELLEKLKKKSNTLEKWLLNKELEIKQIALRKVWKSPS